MNGNTERLNQKRAYIQELLRKNPYMGTDEILEALTKQFHHEGDKRRGGVARAVIGEIRWAEHKLALGPGGRFFNAEGRTVEVPEQFKNKSPAPAPTPAVSTPAPKPTPPTTDRKQRLTSLLAELRAEMKAQEIQRAVIPVEGAVRVTTEVEREINI